MNTELQQQTSKCICRRIRRSILRIGFVGGADDPLPLASGPDDHYRHFDALLRSVPQLVP
jgi:hypothetical protein